MSWLTTQPHFAKVRGRKVTLVQQAISWWMYKALSSVN